MQVQTSAGVQGGPGTSAGVQGRPGGAAKTQHSPSGQAECKASLALTMLLMLKQFLKATYNMSEERIAAFSPDLPEKRKQVSSRLFFTCCQT